MKSFDEVVSISFFYFRKDTGFFDIVRPGNVSDIREVPDYIIKPEYVFSGKHIPGPSKPEIKSADQIASMRDSCKLAKMILNVIGENIEVRYAHKLPLHIFSVHFLNNFALLF